MHPSDLALVLKSANGKMVSQVLKWGYESPQRRGVILTPEQRRFGSGPCSAMTTNPADVSYRPGSFTSGRSRKAGKEAERKYDFFAEGEILFMAGIYHKDLEGDRFAVLTRAAAGCMSEIHDRMPLLLTGGDIEKWLFSRDEADRLLSSSFDRLQRRRSGGEEYRQLSLF